MPDAPSRSVASLWRYPVKSMLGEQLSTADLTERGVLGDRAYALIDSADHKAATAKNPKKWPSLFGFQASLVEPPRNAATVAPVRIMLPDGATATSQQVDVNAVLSKALNRTVTLEATRDDHREAFNAEQYLPDSDTVSEFTLPEGTFFDCATVHLLTTATLDQLQQTYPQGRFEVARFRPNIVITPAAGESGFVENAWTGRTLVIGNSVRLRITGPAGRCVMTTLAQGDLPADPGILRTAAQHNGANVGVYASVERGGTIRRGDAVRLE